MSYRQVGLIRHDSVGGVARTVTYIPANLAISGKNVQLKAGDQWEDWIVENVSEVMIGDEVAKRIKQKHHDGWNNNI
jgi:hypothetical protein